MPNRPHPASDERRKAIYHPARAFPTFSPMKRANDIANIRALCALGLPSEQLVPALLEALHRIIPSKCNLFDWTDPKGNLVRYYFEGPIDAEVTRHYFEVFHNRREKEVMPAFRDVVDAPVVRRAAELDHAGFFRSALYNEIWKPQGLCSRVEAVIHGTGRRPLGSLVLYRGPGDAAFTRRDESLLATMVPYIARALETDGEIPQDYVRRHNRSAHLSLSSQGKLQQVSRDAQKLLLLAHGGITPEGAARTPRPDAYPTLGLLVEQVRRNQGLSRANASVTLENAWGRFLFEAEPLMSLDAAGPSSIHVTIHHDEPRVIAQRRTLAALPLSVAQKEVCALLQSGCTQAEIAETLSIAPSTVADHVKKIYGKLDVHSVQELRQLLDWMGDNAVAHAVGKTA